MVVAGLAIAAMLAGPRLKDRLLGSEPVKAEEPSHPVALAAGRRDTVRLELGVVQRLPVTTTPLQPSSIPLPLELSGSLMLDANALSHVHARFPGEVVEVGKRAGDGRAVDFGMSVSKGDLLAVIWSQDLGEKKSELVDALSQLWLDEETLAKLRQSSLDGAVPDRTVREAQRRVEADRIAVARAERTLQTWRLAEEEIQAVREEARRLSTEKAKGPADNAPHGNALAAKWARIEIRAPLSGVILERNLTLGDLVDTTVDLFMIADLNRLRVTAHAYEEYLPALDGLVAGKRDWAIAVPAAPHVAPQRGQFEQIGRIIDPNQHTALVMGWVDNAQGKLRVGQFITATVELPPAPHELAVPISAVVDQGSRSLVFIQPDPYQPVFTRRQVAVCRRAGNLVVLHGQPSAEERQRGAQPLVPGELIVISGAVQLLAALDDLQTSGEK